MAEERFDGVFMSTVQQAQGIDNFFDALFAFMRRKTDLFTKADQARGTVNQAMEKNIKLFQEDIVRKEAITRKRQEDAAKQAAHNAAVKKAAEDHKVESSDAIMEVSEEEARQIELEEAAKKAGKTIAKAEEKKDGDDDDASKGALPNSANGGNLEKYNWGQSLQEVTVNVYLPDGTTSKMLNVAMTSKKCSVKIKNGATIIEGDWFKPIKLEDSPWCIETDGKGRKILQLNL